MSAPLKTVDQSGVRALLKATLEQPEWFADKPLLIWQSAWHDGSLQVLVHKAYQDLTKDKAREDRRYYQ